MNTHQTIYKELHHRILILDGAMGTMIQRFQLSEKEFRGEHFANHSVNLKGCNDLLNLTRPEIIKSIHLQYLSAGADIIETNTFNSNAISLSDYHLSALAYKLNFHAAQIARNAVDIWKEKHNESLKFIAGSIGPTSKSASIPNNINSPGERSVDWKTLFDAYSEQIEGLIDGGVDILLIETIFDTLNAKAALVAAKSVMQKKSKIVPIMISGTIADISGRILSGQTVEAFVTSLTFAPLLSIGLNCSFGAEQLTPFVKELNKISPIPISVYPNAGLPDVLGKYSEQPKHTASLIKQWAEEGLVNIVGGCCGTTPEHIKEIAKAVQGIKPRTIYNSLHQSQLSGLENIIIQKENNFINIGERTNVAGSKKFAQLIREKQYDKALVIAREQVENGAQILDVNMDDPLLHAKDEMQTFLRFLTADPFIAKVPIMLDSSKLDVIEAGLQCLQGKSIVNSISLKEGEESFLNAAQTIRKYGAAIVVMAIDENGQATTFKKKIEICKRAEQLLTGIGIPAEDIIFDVNILTIATGMDEHNNYAVEFIHAVEWLKKNLPGTKTSGGISNLSFAFRGNDMVREGMHAVFLYHAIKAGLDMGIVNAGKLPVYDEIPDNFRELLEDVVLNRRKDATKRLIAYAEHHKQDKTSSSFHLLEWRKLPLEKKIIYSLVNGIDDYLQEDMNECRKQYPSGLNVIEGPLMTGMEKVGELFGNGKMFLPQVVKSARIMKQAVFFLQPWIEQSKGKSSFAGKIVLATVKGDVHDIGKNIVNVVLSCNNYEVIDLGVMVSPEKIVDTAIDSNADIIGLSGLITPSLEEMILVAKEMQVKKLHIPLLIGGATTSELHTALKIAPEYKGPVVYVHDASQASHVVALLLSKEKRKEFVENIYKKYKTLSKNYRQQHKKIQFVPLKEARENKFILDTTKVAPEPAIKDVQYFKDYDIKKIVPYVDYSYFFKEWGIKGTFPKVLSDPVYGAEATKLLHDAQYMLQQICNEKWLVAQASFGIFPAFSNEDDVFIHYKKKQYCLSFLRAQRETKGVYPCLADFIASEKTKIHDHIGLFAVSMLESEVQITKKWKKEGNEYEWLLFKILSNRLAEAFAEHLFMLVRTQYWKYMPQEKLTVEAILKRKYQGIRPAPGYPACPDHSEKKKLFCILEIEKQLQFSLTDSYMIQPLPSICGYYFAHPDSFYFSTGKIYEDQIADYAQRKNSSVIQVKKMLQP